VELQGEGPATLTARTALVVRASGRVTGTVRYGRLEVEPGGVLQGDLAPLTSPAAAEASLPPAPPGGKKR
jgi:cytoskeletal protein CcmA (bactofilin family)